MIKQTIVLSRLPFLEHRIEKLNKRAINRGLEGFSIECGERLRKKIEMPIGSYMEDFIEVEIKGELPRLPGYTLLGIKKIKDGIPVFAGNLPAKYRSEEIHRCDHCNTNRRREFIAVVKKDVEENELVIGSTCFKHIFGHVDAESLIAYGNLIQRIYEELIEWDEEGSVKLPAVYEVDRYLSIVCMVADECGFVSVTKGEEAMILPTHIEAVEAYKKITDIDDSYRKKAANIFEFFKHMDLNTCSTFEANVKVCLEAKYLTIRNTARAASAYSVYQKYLEDQQETLRESEYVGEVKKRFEMEAIFRKRSMFFSLFGTASVYAFLVNGTDSVVWCTSSVISGQYEKVEEGPGKGLCIYQETWFPEPGDIVKLRATVKSHGKYKNRQNSLCKEVKTTYISRAKVLSVRRGNEEFTLL